MNWFWRAIIALAAGCVCNLLANNASAPLYPLAFRVYESMMSHFRDRGPSPQAGVVVFLVWGLAPMSISIAIYGILTWRQYKSAGLGETRCRRCSYILRGISEPRCPECGEKI